MKNITYGLSTEKGHFSVEGRLLGRGAACDLTELQRRNGNVSQMAEGKSAQGCGRLRCRQQESIMEVWEAHLRMDVPRKTVESHQHYSRMEVTLSSFP